MEKLWKKLNLKNFYIFIKFLYIYKIFNNEISLIVINTKFLLIK